MKLKNLVSMVALMVGMGFLLMAYVPGTDWVVPDKYKTMKNPKVGVADKDGIGAELYETHCASCHGDEGLGDGKKAENLDAELRDFSSKAVQSQTDGELYYKSFIGRDEMPNFEKKIPDENERWFLVNYLRKLAK